jgi:predicted DNA-binding transcriptional regulator YafY
MSAKEARDVMFRHWHMLKNIPAHGNGITVSELTKRLEDSGFSIDKRSVQRNLVDLSLTFPITNDEAKPAPRWFWIKDASLDVPNLSITDALSIKMMQDYLTPLLPKAMLRALQSRFEQADNCLTGKGNNLVKWPHKIRTVMPGQPLQSPVIADGVLEVVQQALLQEHQIKAQYQSRFSTDTTEYVLHPLALVQRGPVSYLVATAFSYEDVRLYALHRFTSVELLEDEAVIPKSFDIDQYIKNGALSFGSGEPFVLKLRIQADLKKTLTESPLSDDMTITPEGDAFLVTATVQDTWQLKWWIRSQGPQAEVLEPVALREEFCESLKQTLRLYSPTV